MSLELIAFIASILFGIVLYWRESKNNSVYRFFNSLFYAKALQMEAKSRKGFLYQQSFLMRLVYIGALFLITIVIVRFLIPIDLATLSLFASTIFGTLLGTYLANFVFKSTQVIDEKSESLIEAVKDSVEKGKEFIQDLEAEDAKEEFESELEIEVKTETIEKTTIKTKSARDRLKEKGLM
ncbi:MAG: hypothetical protein ACPGUH_00690 [Winogradskyella sp.]